MLVIVELIVLFGTTVGVLSNVEAAHPLTNALIVFLVVLAIVALIGLTLSVKVVTQYQRGVLFRLGKVVGVKEPGLALIIPVIDRLVRVSLGIVTMPIQSQGVTPRPH
jgi:regulator of protease activity HflC (stomatin/prohibitin superfamily)